ncbi:MAG: hypothetical protein EAX89_15670 [Candidatus Lokiarchaeota archaeon]|nr:hypothetical protein [Candidatus Lokiarchaeota archaeon]
MKYKQLFLLLIILLVLPTLLPKLNQFYSNTKKVNLNVSELEDHTQIQNLELNWYQIWGGLEYEWGGYLVVDSSENIYITGSTESYGKGSRDVFLAKYNNLSQFLWNITWGGPKREDAYGIALVKSNNVYIVGGTYSYSSGGCDLCLIKFNENGLQQNNFTWGGKYDDYGTSIAIDNENNIYITGMTNSTGLYENDIFLIKLNSSLLIEWVHTWGGSKFDMGYDIAIDNFSNIYVGGRTDSFGSGSGDICVIKYNNSGTQIWNRTWGGTSHDYCSGIAIDSSDSIYIAGSTSSYGSGQFDICLLKYNHTGLKIWEKIWGGNYNDEARAIAIDESKNVYITGESGSSQNPEGNLCLLGFNYLGDVNIVKTWGGSDKDIGISVQIQPNCSYYIGGWTESYGDGVPNIVLLKYSESSGGGELLIYGFNELILVISILGIILIKVARKKMFEIRVL